MKKKIAIFPGSFDPFTMGHADIVNRGLKIFDEVIIAVGYNTSKKNRYFDLEFMIEKIEETYKDQPNVTVLKYAELTAEFAKKVNANYLLRGLRNTTDFEYENSISQVNRHLNENLETVFLITSPEYASISSTVIREVHKYNGNIKDFLPYTL
ncbi:pantetheine-phosphate adenylyltransferase [Aureibacter tunicatorum]|uniref:Phosphopantetheine adenylyltransferase n=1 Tax=Aureibacter tunicatorum TaxID=866807 RepID=A0AAE3XLS9_9BACT|nr:pantetheine-phosphate adenylyltransferase [Aureibacter tunicatorum]MDR6238358.1 pantetheine-phosphate adenylyltransferase [Aureibacter tunicatorum]BDD03390.1 phosphopantetheine adenylyltransferase [Aureibacter tunicatorum]